MNGVRSALQELQRLGFATVDTDEGDWTEWSHDVGGYVWREDLIAELLAGHDGPCLYVSGTVSNQGRFYDRFDAVVLLSAPRDVLLNRIETRTTNPYGKTTAQRELVLRDLSEVEPLLRRTCTHEIDTTRPLGDVVTQLAAGKALVARNRRAASFRSDSVRAMSLLRVEEPVAFSDELLEAVNQLVGQLSRSAHQLDQEQLSEMLASPSSRFLIGRDRDDRIRGMLTLVLFRIPTGVRAWIEDVVVDASVRGQGLGSLLVREAVTIARTAGARTVDLTSRPDREAANALYMSQGFELRETNVYRVTLD